MSPATYLRIVAMAILLALSGGFSAGGATAAPGGGDACVRDFFEVAREQYGWSPHEIVVILNTDNDPNDFRVANVQALRELVINAGLGIFDRNGAYHICPNPM